MATNKDTFVNTLVEGADDIKDYYFMVERFGAIGADCYHFEADDGMDADEKWYKISDLFKGFGYSAKRFSASKCRDRFYQWSAFYAKVFKLIALG